MLRRIAVTAGLLGVSLALSGIASAATFKPTRFDDPKPNGCKQADCSLREAVVAANKTDAGDKIRLAKGRYKLAIPDDGTDDARSGDLDLIERVSVIGKGPSKTKVDGRGVDTVFQLLTFPSHALTGMTIMKGSGDHGGGIYIAPNKATIKNVVVKKNSASEEGGGIYSVSTDLTISRSSIVGNDAPLGGGIYSPAGIVGNPTGAVVDSTISGNSAVTGGGIYIDGTVDGSRDDTPSAGVVNSTIAGNQSTGNAGGAGAIAGAILDLDNTTVALNEANSDDTGGGAGGGMYDASTGSIAFADSILTNNTVGAGGTSPQCSADTVGGTNVFSGAMTGCTVSGDGTLDVMLGPLAKNGGPTKTISLLSGSPAINNGNEGCPERDQRGETRPGDASKCDAGAFERKPSDP